MEITLLQTKAQGLNSLDLPALKQIAPSQIRRFDKGGDAFYDQISALHKSIVVSVDTSKPDVAAKALRAGAQVINDVTGLSDPQMAAVTADAQATVVMHMRGTPATMRGLTDYDDVVTYDGEFGPDAPVPDTHIRWGAFEQAVLCLNAKQLALADAAQAAERQFMDFSQEDLR